MSLFDDTHEVSLFPFCIVSHSVVSNELSAHYLDAGLKTCVSYGRLSGEAFYTQQFTELYGKAPLDYFQSISLQYMIHANPFEPSNSSHHLIRLSNQFDFLNIIDDTDFIRRTDLTNAHAFTWDGGTIEAYGSGHGNHYPLDLYKVFLINLTCNK
jgi:hypothetical protein